MSATSKIEWTDRTWNPTRGCSVISPGCVNCYAMKQAHRFSGRGKAYEGLTKLTKAGPQWTGKVVEVGSALSEPLSWRTPARVFVDSMSDLFHENVDPVFIGRVFNVMAQARRHTFQVLTKRADRMQQIVPMLAPFHAAPDGSGWPLPNVWLGVSAENQEQADKRIPLLLQTPAVVRFISAEPLLGPIDLNAVPWLPHACEPSYRTKTALGWVIVGGESGAHARKLHVSWVRSIVEQCKAVDIPVFVKQLGAHVRDRNDAGFTGDFDDSGTAWPEQHLVDDRIQHDPDGSRDGYQGAPVRIHLKDRKGGDMAEWPDDLRVREFPEARA